MFDHIKLQIEIIKALNNEKNRERVRVCLDDLDVLITPDGVRAYRIPAALFYLDATKITAFDSLSNIMNTAHGQEVELTNEMTLSENGKDKLLIFKFEDGKRAYFKEKHINTILPKLHAKHYYHFYMETPKTMLKVFKGGECVAAFMPVVFKNKG